MKRILLGKMLEEAVRKYRTALNNGDHEEARGLLDTVYESEFLKYRILAGARKEFEGGGVALSRLYGQQNYERKFREIDLCINITISNLEGLLRLGLILTEIQGDKKC